MCRTRKKMTAGHELYSRRARPNNCVKDSAPLAQKIILRNIRSLSVTLQPRVRYCKQGEMQAPNRREGSIPVFTQDATRETRTGLPSGGSQEVCEPVQAAEIVLRRLGARAISILTSPRQLEDGRWIPARLSANDCYVALEEACRK